MPKDILTDAEGVLRFPASYAQERLWFLEQLQPGILAYLIPWTIPLNGDLNVDALARTLNELVRRHRVFRTTFAMENGQVMQLIAPTLRIPLVVEDLRGASDPEAEARRKGVAEAEQALDLARGPLLRARLLVLGPQRHQLLLTLHHIIFDGSSRAIFTREFEAIYSTFREGRERTDLPEPRVHYSDYAVWQRRMLAGPRLQEMLAYWKKQLQGAPDLLQLPTDRPRPDIETFHGAILPFRYSKHLADKLGVLSRKHKASLFMTTLAAYQALLSRYSAQQDIVVGVPIAGRTRNELEGIVGFFANELAMRLDLSGDPTFEELIDRQRDCALDAYANQDLPFSRLVEELNPERNTGHNPIFQVQFSMRNYRQEAFHLPGLKDVAIEVVGGDTAKFDLSLFVSESADGLSGWWEYSSDLFDAATIERMSEHYRILLEAVVKNPGLHLSELPLLTSAERQQIISEWNATEHSVPREKALHQLIEEQVARTPLAEAVAFESSRLSYQQLNDRANQVAHYLRGIGAGPESLVAVCAHRSIEMVVALVGVLKAGAAYVPFDPEFPLERLAGMLADCQPAALLTQEHLLPKLPDSGSIPVACLDLPSFDGQPVSNPVVRIDPRNLAYVIYTSGSTGKPKGAGNTHEAIVNRILWMQDRYGLDPTDRVLQKTPYSFDVSVWEFFWPLLTGASLVVARPEGHKDPDYLAELIRQENVSTLHFVPSMLRAFLDAARVEDCSRHLKRVICSGEALPYDTLQRFFSRLPSIELHNLYGPTEAAVDVTEWACSPNDPGPAVPIGRPIWNTQIYILDPHMQPVPAGIAGELYIGGIGLARGYVKRPDLTAERFVPSPFGRQGERLYRTGDLCRFRSSDGAIEYLGRLDFQVKIRGFRIELGEIESVLAQHPLIRQCVVMAREDTPGDQRLVAYVVPPPDYWIASGTATDLSQEQVSQWALTFDEAYRKPTASDDADSTFNLAGWNSSYTGQAIPVEEMRVWVDSTVSRIRELGAKRIWEIGCGTGLLLFPLAPTCEFYLGSDVSQRAIDGLASQTGQLPQVSLECAPAHVSAKSRHGCFDAVVLNSVIQYFPSIDYLTGVLASAIDAIRSEGGSIFLGDLRNFRLLEAFHSSVELHRAEDSTPASVLQQSIAQAVRNETELTVDPAYFCTELRNLFPRLGRVDIQVKRGWSSNELTCFRYDVTLHVRGTSSVDMERNAEWLNWNAESLSLAKLEELLTSNRPELLGVTGIPNVRIQADIAALRILSEEPDSTAESIRIAASAARERNRGIEPEELWALESRLPYSIEIRPAAGSTVDVLFRRTDCKNLSVPFPFPKSVVSFANSPLRRAAELVLVSQLRELAATSLPAYMVPSEFVELEALPLSANGKIDRKALPRPDALVRRESVNYQAPESDVELRLAALWSAVLRISRIGKNDNFFHLGGHSLLGTQLVSRARDAFQIELPVRMLFDSPTLGEMAAAIQALRANPLRSSVNAPIALRSTEPAPLSWAQKRLWFLDQLHPGSAIYSMPWIMRLHGKLDRQALAASLDQIVKRHEPLRTRFVDAGGGNPVQIVEPWRPGMSSLEVVQGCTDEDAARARVQTEILRPFNLELGPPFRATLLALGEEDHVLVLNTHHIVSDAWSLSVLWRELSAIYRGHPLAELPFSYGDYAVWQQQQQSEARLRADVAYWKRVLAGVPALELPSDRVRPAVESFRGGRCSDVLPEETLRQVKALCRQEGLTLYMTVLSALGVVLSRYSGQTDFAIGTPVSGRTRRETEALIGLFVNTVAIRMPLAGDPTVRELLTRVRANTLEAYEHQDLAFERLVEEVQPDRNLGRNPLFQVMLALQNVPPADDVLPGITVSPFQVKRSSSKFDFTLFATETEGGLSEVCEYSTDLFDESTIVSLLEHLRNTLEAFVRNPDQRISQLRILTRVERRRILEQWNATAVDVPTSKPLHRWIEEQVERTPDAIALTFESESLTYRQLNHRANRIAHALIRLGAGPEQVVGVSAYRSVELVLALVAILKSGAAYVPFDPEYPKERLAGMLAECKPVAVLTEESIRSFLEETCPESNPAVEVYAQNLAYVIYTSGSTGAPKGAGNTHEGIVNRILWMQHAYGLNGSDRVLQKTPYSFDVSVWEFFWPLLTGATLVVARPDGHKDPAYLVDLIRQAGITTMHFVPSMMRVFLEDADAGKCDSLRRVICSGEALAHETQQKFFAVLPSTELHNLYGPTEAAVDVTAWKCDPEYPSNLVPIGKPIWNTAIYILDANLQPVPTGVPGELYIGGIGLARGYVNRPDLTAERFIPDPFGTGAGERLYKTGDQCRFLKNGEIEYLGRLDFQVKLRGFRIELGEIEAQLRQQPNVADCVVTVREDSGERRLVAYIVMRDGTSAPADLRDQLARKLPDYMVPAAFVYLGELPLTTSGKVDRKALPAPELSAHSGGWIAPRNPVEEILAGLWAEVLGLERVSVEDDFFDLGGHSLLAAKLVARIRTAFRIELPLRDIFESPTIARLGSRVESLKRTQSGATPLPAIVKTARTGVRLPLSFAQQRLWFLDQLDPGRPHYNIPKLMRFRGALNVEALERSIDEIVRRHEILRTTYVSVDGVPGQVIAEQLRIPLRLVDLSASPVAETEGMGMANEDAARSFDLAAGPLLRAALIRIGAEDHLFLITMHHIVTERWSQGILWGELSSLYSTFVAGGQSNLAELSIQYADYAAWQRNWLQGETLEAEVGYWRKQLAAAPPLLELPTDRPRPAYPSRQGDTVSSSIDCGLLQRIEALSRKHGATTFMTLVAAFQSLLSRYTGQQDIVVGTTIAGRPAAELEPLIGFFVNTLALRTDLSGNPAFSEIVERVRSMALDAYAHQNVPFEKLVEELEPNRSLSHNPIIQVMIVHDQAAASPQMPGLQFEGLQLHQGSSIFDITWYLVEQPEGMRLFVEFDTDLFDRSTIQRMLGQYLVLLQAITENASLPLSQIPLLEAAEREQLVHGWNSTARNLPSPICLHHWIERQVELTPDAVALVFGSEQLTYREMNRSSNKLAHMLIGLGAGPEQLVAVQSLRSLEMVIALVATLKSGAAYVPFDPEYPQERLAAMSADCKPIAVLTEEQVRNAIDGDWPAINPNTKVDDKNLAYVIYTSGSTGIPKGVGNTHQGIVNRLLWMQDAYRLNPSDRVLQKTPYSFDVSVWEFFWPLMTGATLVVARPDGHKDPAYLVDLIRTREISTMHFVPSMLRVFLEASGVDKCSSLRRVICSGEALAYETQQKFFGLLPSTELHNLYGPTEAAVDVTFWPCDPNYWRGIVPIGRPIWNTAIYILDAEMQPVPVGVPGELYIGGIGLARGYVNRPELTADRFVPNPFGSEQGDRLYKTGDLCRFLESGEIEYLGRLDFQVKLRGFRIELGEVEATLNKHPEVLQSVVIVREDHPGLQQLVAYIVADSERRPSSEELRVHVRSSLPEFMTPNAFVFLDEFPLTSSGKVNRKALRAVSGASLRNAEYIAPRTSTEEAVARVWSEVLGHDRVSANGDFFELGGHSLSATRAVSRIRELLGVDLSLRSLFETPRVDQLSTVIDRLTEASLQPPPMVRVPRNQRLPLSFAQQRLWLIDQLDPRNPLYNVARAMRMKGPLSIAALSRALDEIVRRHESQRTTFVERDGNPEQIIGKPFKVALDVEDLTALPADDRIRTAYETARRELLLPFDLAVGPLVRAKLLRLDQEDHVLLFLSHHIVSDGWSSGILTREMGSLYEAFTEGRTSPLEELPVQYADYAAWQRKWLQGPVLDRQMEYWRGHLAGAPPVLELPTDRSRTDSTTSMDGTHLVIPIPGDLVQSLRALSRENDATLFMTMLAAYEAMLFRLSGQDQMVIGTDSAGRNTTETESMMGFFINILPLRTDLSGNPTFLELLRRVRNVTLDAFDHMEMPFDRLVQELQPERTATHSPLVQSLFVMQNTPKPKRQMAGLEIVPFDLPLTHSRFDLAVFVLERGDEFQGYWVYRTALFERETIARLGRNYETLLRNAVARPEARLSELEIYTEEEKRELAAKHDERKRQQRRKLISTQARTITTTILANDREAE